MLTKGVTLILEIILLLKLGCTLFCWESDVPPIKGLMDRVNVAVAMLDKELYQEIRIGNRSFGGPLRSPTNSGTSSTSKNVYDVRSVKKLPTILALSSQTETLCFYIADFALVFYR